MIIKSNNETIYNKILGAVIRMGSNPNDAIFAFTLMGVPIYINVDDRISGDNQNLTDSLIYTDGRGIVITGNLIKVNRIFDAYGVTNVLKHELEHILLNHISRSKEIVGAFKDYRDSDIMNIFNIASDYIINKDLKIENSLANKDLEFVSDKIMRDKFGLYPEDLEKKSAEEIVMMMIKNNPPTKISEMMEEIKNLLNGDGFGGVSSFSHVCQNNKPEFDEFVAKNSKNFGGDFNKYLADVIKNAITTYGYGQSNIWKKLDGIYGKPLVNWNSVLTDELRQHKSREIAENGVKVVNRRYYQLSSYINTPILFTNMKRTFKDGVIAIDTSGSITDETYMKEISQVIRLVKNEGLDWKILLFDDGIVLDENKNPVIYHTKNISINELTDKLLNRTYGGTNIKEVLDYCNKDKTKFLILISDMEFNYDLPKYDRFKKIFISTETSDETGDKVKEICDTLAFFNPY